MSIVLHGMGVDVDSESSIVAFGLARDLTAGETIESAVSNASIENVFVIDFGQGRRKASKAEYRRFKRLSRMMLNGQLKFKENKRHRNGVEYWADRSRTTRKVA